MCAVQIVFFLGIGVTLVLGQEQIETEKQVAVFDDIAEEVSVRNIEEEFEYFYDMEMMKKLAKI